MFDISDTLEFYSNLRLFKRTLLPSTFMYYYQTRSYRKCWKFVQIVVRYYLWIHALSRSEAEANWKGIRTICRYNDGLRAPPRHATVPVAYLMRTRKPFVFRMSRQGTGSICLRYFQIISKQLPRKKSMKRAHNLSIFSVFLSGDAFHLFSVTFYTVS